MTIEELRLVVEAAKPKISELSQAASSLEEFTNFVWDMIKPENEMAGTIDVDQFIAIQVPIYNARIARVQAAISDLIGALQ